MGIIHSDLDEREAAALAHYHAAQQQMQVQEAAAPSRPQPARNRDVSAERDHVGQPLPRGSRLPERQSRDGGPASIIYTVQRGDTLRGIADWFYGDRSRSLIILAANRSTIRDPETVEEGMELIIPRQRRSVPLA